MIRQAVARAKALFFIIAVIAPGSSLAAGPVAGLGPQLTTEEGLPQSTVTAILPARSGYLWLGTFGGLVRFDGRHVKVYTATNTTGLSSNRVLSLAEDQDGLWVGTEHDGVFRLTFQGDTATVTEHLLPEHAVAALVRDQTGSLWIGTSKGLMRWSGGRLLTSADDPRLPVGRIQSLDVDNTGRLWVGLSRGVTLIDRSTVDRIPAVQSCAVPYVRATPAGGVWLATSCGLFEVAPSGAAELLHTGNFWTVTRGANGLVWGGTYDGHVIGLRGRDTVHTIEANAGPIRALALDAEDALWFGTNQNGAGRWRQPAISHVLLPDAENVPVLPVVEDGSGSVWVGAWCNGLFRIRDGRAEQIPLPTGKRNRCVTTLSLDPHGRLWVGGSGGVLRIDRPADLSTTAQVAADTTPPVYVIHHAADGRVWLGTEQGLAEWQPDRLLPDPLPSKLSNRQVRFITETADGALWLGTTGGFARRRNDAWDVWTQEDGLSHPFVRAIQADGEHIWIATYGGGINLLAAGRLTACTSRIGLPDDAISRLLDDGQGSFWITSNRGVFKVSKSGLAACAQQGIKLSGIVPLTRADGMPSTEANGGAQPSGWRARDGRLWIPTSSGLALIDPTRLSVGTPRVVIQRVSVGEQELSGHEAVLAAGTERLEIRYAALTFAFTHRVRFRHRLDGYDSVWIDAGDEQSARYTSLPPGTFRFRLAVSLGDGEWRETDATHVVIQRAYLYQHAWFIAVLGVATLLAGYGMNRVRVRRLERQTRELESRVAERTTELEQQRNTLRDVNAQLAAAHENLQTVLDRLAVGALMLDAGGRVLFMNRSARSLLYRESDSYAGIPWHELLPLGAEERQQIEQMAERPASERTRLTFPAANVFDRHFSMEIDVHDDPRNPSQKILFLYDVSELFDLRRFREQGLDRYGLVGESSAMRMLLKQIQDVSLADATVLIEGETGSGKELVARAIHSASNRRQRPFVAVNCGGLTESLLASQLFGHRRGAFTGAIADQVGVFEAAHGGTLFLDEIGDIPLSVQTTLLRVLQEREIVRVGESTPRRVDIRILAATHRNLDAEVAAGRLRQDLLYRIRVVRVRVPPLRDRRDDIPLLVGRFLTELRRTSGDAVTTGVSRDAMVALMEYPWPGNVRELRSAIESATLAGRSSVIQREDLPPEVRLGAVGPASLRDETQAPDATRIREALVRTRGNRAAAARALGIGRTTLYRRLKELGLEP